MRTLGTEKSRLYTRALLLSPLLLLSCNIGGGFIRGGLLAIITISSIGILMPFLPGLRLGGESQQDAITVIMFAGAFILVHYLGTGFNVKTWAPREIAAAFSASLGCVLILQVLFPLLSEIEKRNLHLIDRKLLFIMVVLAGLSWMAISQRMHMSTLKDSLSELEERQERADSIRKSMGGFVSKIVLVDREGNRYKWRPPVRREGR